MQEDKLLSLKKEIMNHKIISFDLFDTLVFRDVCNPEDIFLLLNLS